MQLCSNVNSWVTSFSAFTIIIPFSSVCFIALSSIIEKYFVKKVAEHIISFEEGRTKWYEYGYEEYEKSKKSAESSPIEADFLQPAKTKKTYTTPAKEKAKKERAIKKAEDSIAVLEEELEELRTEINKPENQTDYIKLTELQQRIDEIEMQLLEKMEEWEKIISQ